MTDTALPTAVIEPNKTSRFLPWLWAIYLACSWTWCIGMFLPVILMRYYGLGAWFVFAIPNVLGAAAMGWVLKSTRSSEKIVAKHHTACVAFSAVTLSFHAYWLFMLSVAGIIPPAWSITAIVAGTVFALIRPGDWRIDLVLAVLVLAVSLTVLGKGLSHPVIGDRRGMRDEQALVAILSLGPVCVFGFLLCPYLDVTFHRARQMTSAPGSRIAFGFGFGLFFLAMIVLTMLYEGDFADRPGTQDHFGSFGFAALVTWVACHMAVQAGFTWGAHLRSLPTFRKSHAALWGIAILLFGAGAFVIVQNQWTDSGHAMLMSEAVYRCYMAFYGLVFPAYVWLCMTPLRNRQPKLNARNLIILGATIAVAGVMFYLGFIAQKMPWLLPGVSIVIAARTLIQTESLDPSVSAVNS